MITLTKRVDKFLNFVLLVEKSSPADIVKTAILQVLHKLEFLDIFTLHHQNISQTTYFHSSKHIPNHCSSLFSQDLLLWGTLLHRYKIPRKIQVMYKISFVRSNMQPTWPFPPRCSIKTQKETSFTSHFHPKYCSKFYKNSRNLPLFLSLPTLSFTLSPLRPSKPGRVRIHAWPLRLWCVPFTALTVAPPHCVSPQCDPLTATNPHCGYLSLWFLFMWPPLTSSCALPRFALLSGWAKWRSVRSSFSLVNYTPTPSYHTIILTTTSFPPSTSHKLNAILHQNPMPSPQRNEFHTFSIQPDDLPPSVTTIGISNL